MNALEALAFMQPRGPMRSWDRPSARDWAQVLASFPLFSGIRKRRLRKLVRKAAFAEYAAGETVLSNGEGAASLYLILGGAAKARDRGARALGIGDYFGEAALNEGTSGSTAVVATRELHVMRLPRQSVLRLGFALTERP